MKRNLITLAGLVALFCVTSCTGLYRGVITVTEVRDDVMKELAQLNKRGLIDQQTDELIFQADWAYLQAAKVAERALVSYQNGGDRAAYISALNALKDTVGVLIGLLNPLNTNDAQLLEARLAKASKP